jgi:hypothetical protein
MGNCISELSNSTRPARPDSTDNRPPADLPETHQAISQRQRPIIDNRLSGLAASNRANRAFSRSHPEPLQTRSSTVDIDQQRLPSVGSTFPEPSVQDASVGFSNSLNGSVSSTRARASSLGSDYSSITSLDTNEELRSAIPENRMQSEYGARVKELDLEDSMRTVNGSRGPVSSRYQDYDVSLGSSTTSS